MDMLFIYYNFKIQEKFVGKDNVIDETYREGSYLLESNSFAGLMCTPKDKPCSYIGFMAAADGMSASDLIDEIVKSALKRYKMI